jgi:type I restriction enzyme M protein
VPRTALADDEHEKNNLPDILARWGLRDGEERERLKATHRACLAELDALFTSLQHRAFRGEL